MPERQRSGMKTAPFLGSNATVCLGVTIDPVTARDQAAAGDGESAMLRVGIAVVLASALTACSPPRPVTEAEPPPTVEVTNASFTCIRDMKPVRGFFVTNLLGQTDATVRAAEAGTGVYPVGSLVQLVPGEAMVKREAGFSAVSHDWEFIELDVKADGATIRVRGTDKAVNRFGGNCLECHAKARPEFDLICEKDHGCDPIPLTPAMTTAIQKTDPRCAPTALTDEEKEALALLASLTASPPAADAAKKDNP